MCSEGAPCLIGCIAKVEVVVLLRVIGQFLIIVGGGDINWCATLPSSEEPGTQQLTTELTVRNFRDRVIFEEFVEFWNKLLQLTISRRCLSVYSCREKQAAYARIDPFFVQLGRWIGLPVVSLSPD